MRSLLLFLGGFLFSVFLNYITQSLSLFHDKSEPYHDSQFGSSENMNHNHLEEVIQNSEKFSQKFWQDKGEHSHVGEDIVAKVLEKKVRVLCWILTHPKNHESKAVHVKATWAKRCNKYIFMSSVDDPRLPSVDLKIQESRNTLWGKTKRAFKYVYDHHLNDYDFFMKADDDTYVIMENLRRLLSDFKPTDPVFFGRHFKPIVRNGYMSGGGGYVLSRESVKRFIEKGLNSQVDSICRMDDGGAEDAEMGKCLQSVGVKPAVSLDSLQRERFHPFPPDSYIAKDSLDKGNWLWSYNYHPLKVGPECCSDLSISFHYVSPRWMYFMEFVVYHLHPYGIVRDYHHMKSKIEKLEGSLKDSPHDEESAHEEEKPPVAPHADPVKRVNNNTKQHPLKQEEKHPKIKAAIATNVKEDHPHQKDSEKKEEDEEGLNQPIEDRHDNLLNKKN